MKAWLWPRACCIGVCIGAAHAGAVSVADLAWLSGCWASDADEAGSGEQWMAPAGGTMFGVGRTVRAGKTVTHEFMQIRETAAGQLAFVASPAGKPTESFALLKSGPVDVVFENLAHDFPQRVMYRAVGKSVLQARIEGVRQGELKGIDFAMHRVPCDTGQ